MIKYLIHQVRSGQPVGIWSENGDAYYDPKYEPLEAYARTVFESRGSAQSWEEFLEQQASKTPSVTALWDIWETDTELLEDVFAEVLEDTE